jgi:nucleoside-specific outer membrane channel protein Tsx
MVKRLGNHLIDCLGVHYRRKLHMNSEFEVGGLKIKRKDIITTIYFLIFWFVWSQRIEIRGFFDFIFGMLLGGGQ